MLKEVYYGSYGFIDTDNTPIGSIKLLDFGYETRKNEYYNFHNLNRDNYPGYLLQYTLKGEGIFEIEGVEHIIKPNMGFIVEFPSNTRYYLNNGKEWTFFYIHFSGDEFKYIHQLLKKQNSTFCIDNLSPSIQSFFLEYKKVQDGYKYQRFQGAQFLYNFLTQLIIDIDSNLTLTQPVEQATRYIDSNFFDLEAINSITENLNVTLPHISREFKKQKGISLIKYLTKVRLEHAMNQLLSSNKSINTIAKECGYSNGNYFSKVFKREIGTTPTEYRPNSSK